MINLLKSTLRFQKYAECILFVRGGCYNQIRQKSFIYKQLTNFNLKYSFFAFYNFIYFIYFNLKQYVFTYTKYTKDIYDIYEKGGCFFARGDENVL